MALKIVANARRLDNDDRLCSFVKGEDGAQGVRGQSGQRGGQVGNFFSHSWHFEWQIMLILFTFL